MSNIYDPVIGEDDQNSIHVVEMPVLDEECSFRLDEKFTEVEWDNPLVDMFAEEISPLEGETLTECKNLITNLYHCTLRVKTLRSNMAVLIFLLDAKLGKPGLVVEKVGQLMNGSISKSEMSKLRSAGELLFTKPRIPTTLSVSTLYQLSLLDQHEIDAAEDEGKFRGIPLSDLTAEDVEGIRKSEKAKAQQGAQKLLAATIPTPASSTSEEAWKKLRLVLDELEVAADGLGQMDNKLFKVIGKFIQKVRAYLNDGG